MRYFSTHAGKGVLAITGAAIVLAVPIALPWVVAVVLLQYGVRQIILAFKEVDRDVSLHAYMPEGGTSLPETHDGQRVLDGAGRDLVLARSQVQ
jgi:hypothetical protein